MKFIKPISIAAVLVLFCVFDVQATTAAEIRCRDRVGGMTYVLKKPSKLNSVEIIVNGKSLQLEDFVARFEPVYQKGQFLYNRWVFEGFYKSGYADRLVLGDYIEVSRGGRLDHHLDKLLSIEHHPSSGAPLLYSESIRCR